MKIVTFYDRILHKKNDGFFNNLEPSCHHLGFFEALSCGTSVLTHMTS